MSPIIERGGCKGGLGGQATEDATFGGGAAAPATEGLASASGTTTYGEGGTPGDAESVPRPLDTIYTSKYALPTLPARSTQGVELFGGGRNLSPTETLKASHGTILPNSS